MIARYDWPLLADSGPSTVRISRLAMASRNVPTFYIVWPPETSMRCTV